MNNFFQQLIQQFREAWGRLNRTQKILLLAVPSVLFAGLLTLILLSNRSRYEVLYSRLEQKDAADVTTELKKENIPYQLASKGNLVMVLVPSEKVYDTRLVLAGQGLPRGNGVGYEIFDQPKWGSTDFTQKVNYKRALEGELQRTIGSLQAIESARVSIVMPEPELFTEKEKPTTASVVLELKPDGQLKKEQVRGIVHLVAASVEGLKPENVSVIDSRGNILSGFIQEEQEDNNPSPDGSTLTQQAKLTLHQMEVQQSFEKDLERKVTSMLNKVLGGNSRFAVSVSVELNFDKTENDSETFEPVVDGQGIARSTQSKKEQFVGDGGVPNNVVGGVPGTDSNVPGYQAAVGSTGQQYSKEENTTNYEINRTVKHNVVAPGSPKRVSVGVFVDNLQPQQVTAIKSAVIAAAGLDVNRGDMVAVENMPFDNTQVVAGLKEAQMQDRWNLNNTLIWMGVLVAMAFGILLFLRSLLKPSREKKYVDSDDTLEPPRLSPQVEDIITPELTAEDLARAEAARDAKKREQVRKEVLDMASRNPENIAQIIKKWLSEE